MAVDLSIRQSVLEQIAMRGVEVGQAVSTPQGDGEFAGVLVHSNTFQVIVNFPAEMIGVNLELPAQQPVKVAVAFNPCDVWVLVEGDTPAGSRKA